MKTVLVFASIITQSAFAIDTSICPTNLQISYESVYALRATKVRGVVESHSYYANHLEDILEESRILSGISPMEYQKVDFRLTSTKNGVCDYTNLDASPIKGRTLTQQTRLFSRKTKLWLRVALTVSSNWGDSVFWVYHQVDGYSQRDIYLANQAESGAVYGWEDNDNLHINMGYANALTIRVK